MSQIRIKRKLHQRWTMIGKHLVQRWCLFIDEQPKESPTHQQRIMQSDNRSTKVKERKLSKQYCHQTSGLRNVSFVGEATRLRKK